MLVETAAIWDTEHNGGASAVGLRCDLIGILVALVEAESLYMPEGFVNKSLGCLLTLIGGKSING